MGLKYILTGAPQVGTYKNGEKVTINHNDVIIKITPVSFWHWLKTKITGNNWYYFEDLRSMHLFIVHDSVIDRYFKTI